MIFKSEVFEVPNQALVREILGFHKSSLERLTKLDNYYRGVHDIFKRKAVIEGNSNSKIMTNYCKTITDTLTSYLISKPIEYKTEDVGATEVISKYNKINDSRDEDYELCKLSSIFGTAYEVMYFDELGELRFDECSPLSTMLVYDASSISEKAIAGVRFKTNYNSVLKKSTYIMQIYTDLDLFILEVDVDGKILSEETGKHFFKSLPIYEIKNNAERQGDFEQIISLQDAYNLASSDWGNNVQNVVNSLLVFTNYNMEQTVESLQFVRKMKETGCISIDSDGDVKYINSQLDTTSVKELLKSLERDIHKISCCPNMSDESFGTNSSGVAMKYKLYNTEQVIGAKERKMYRLLQNRLRLISESPMTSQFNWLDVEFVFKRNIPVNETELIESLVKLKGIISDESLFGMMKFLGIENAETEIGKVNTENKANMGDYMGE
ncbi:MAG: phage portal protein [Fusobacteriaceae bacterium]